MNKFQSLLAGFAAAVGAGGIAAYNGAFSPDTPPAQIASQPVPATAAAPEPAKSATETEAAKTPEAVSPEPDQPAETASAQSEPVAAAPKGPVAPVFDVLRVEPDGSVLVAGKADPEANVDILNGSEIIGKAKAEINGDFAIVLDKPLKPGDYQLVLRATRPDGQTANSVETATVSVPDQLNGPVLALVEEPGQPSRIITAPPAAEAKVAMSAEVPSNTAAAETPAEPETPAPAIAEVTPVPAEPTTPAEAPAVATSQSVGIEAVEVEGDRIFVAGKAGGAAIIRIYANDDLLGDAKPGEGDRFLLDVQKELAPGDYIIRAEGLAADGVTMLSRSSVPFQQAAPEVAQATTPAQNTAAPTPESQSAAEPQKKNVIIRRGDTLWQISRRIYGRGVRYSTIYLANEGIAQNPNRIFPGQVFTIPEKTPEGETANADEIKKRAEQAN